MVRIAEQPGLFDEADEIHISVTFTWDLELAERLAYLWRPVAPVKIGGPATGMKGEAFTPGMYLDNGYTITSRGCPNKCSFCDVWKRDGKLRELTPIQCGHNVLDDNLLACSDDHINAVFAMLGRQKKRPQFTGGLEARRLKEWHIKPLRELKPDQIFFAYDKDRDLRALQAAGARLMVAGFKAHRTLRCYCLCGYKDDTIAKAQVRMREAWAAGFMPMAMLYHGEFGAYQGVEWKKFQRKWSRPAIMRSIMKPKKRVFQWII
jgi:hypothetical protein